MPFEAFTQLLGTLFSFQVGQNVISRYCVALKGTESSFKVTSTFLGTNKDDIYGKTIKRIKKNNNSYHKNVMRSAVIMKTSIK